MRDIRNIMSQLSDNDCKSNFGLTCYEDAVMRSIRGFFNQGAQEPNFGLVLIANCLIFKRGTKRSPLILKALGYTRPANAVNQHCKGVTEIVTPTNGGVQKIRFITKGNVIRLVASSTLPKAEKTRNMDILAIVKETYETKYGRTGVYTKTMVTPNGQMYFTNKYLKDNTNNYDKQNA